LKDLIDVAGYQPDVDHGRVGNENPVVRGDDRQTIGPQTFIGERGISIN